MDLEELEEIPRQALEYKEIRDEVNRKVFLCCTFYQTIALSLQTMGKIVKCLSALVHFRYKNSVTSYCERVAFI